MKFRHGIAKLILTLTVLAGVTTTLADPIFNVFSNSRRSTNGNYYLCDQDNTGDIRIMAANSESEDIGKINVEIYTKASDVGNASKAVAVFTNQ